MLLGGGTLKKKKNRNYPVYQQPYTGRVLPRVHAVTEKNSLNLFC